VTLGVTRYEQCQEHLTFSRFSLMNQRKRPIEFLKTANELSLSQVLLKKDLSDLVSVVQVGSFRVSSFLDDLPFPLLIQPFSGASRALVPYFLASPFRLCRSEPRHGLVSPGFSHIFCPGPSGPSRPARPPLCSSRPSTS